MWNFIQKHKTGILGTIAFHAVLAIFLVIFKFSTPLPLPTEKGILINFGNTEQAGGESALRKNLKSSQEKRQPQTQKQTTEQNQDQEEIITQDNENAPAVKSQEKKETKENQQPDKKQVDTEEKDTKKEEKKDQEEKEKQQEVNKKALYPGKSNEEEGKNEGVEEGEGNQGKETGSPFSDNYSDQNSKGMGGIDFSLKGRNPESLPKPEYNYQEEGKVVVEITVDKYGNVTKASAGVKGSTTLNKNLLQAARKAALNAKFDRKPSAPAYQKGTITYYFILQ